MPTPEQMEQYASMRGDKSFLDGFFQRDMITHYPEQAYVSQMLQETPKPVYQQITGVAELRELLNDLRDLKASLAGRPVETALIKGSLLARTFELLDNIGGL